MCILIVKPANVKSPSRETFMTCFDTNPDGAGFAFSDGRKIVMSKGHMTFSAFMNALESFGDLTDKPVMYHFRIATHGTVKPENTHPFNVNDSIVAAHNGILKISPRADMTDSETFFKDVCAPILTKFSLFSSSFSGVVKSLIDSSKLAFMSDKGEVKMFGSFIQEEGVFYSNSTYKSYYPSYNYSNKAGYYDNMYDDYYDSDYRRSSKSKSGYHTGKRGYTKYDSLHMDVFITYDDLTNFSGLSHSQALSKVCDTFNLSRATVEDMLTNF